VPVLDTGFLWSSKSPTQNVDWGAHVLLLFLRMKAILFTIVRAFEFDLAVPPAGIIKKTSIVQRPVLATDPNGHSQMPLLIKRYNPALML